jgi:hypothetical protein
MSAISRQSQTPEPLDLGLEHQRLPSPIDRESERVALGTTAGLILHISRQSNQSLHGIFDFWAYVPHLNTYCRAIRPCHVRWMTHGREHPVGIESFDNGRRYSTQNLFQEINFSTLHKATG